MSGTRKTCKTCRFWDDPAFSDSIYEVGDLGWCRRYPPVIANQEGDCDSGRIDDVYLRMEAPATWKDEWCGEWKGVEP